MSQPSQADSVFAELLCARLCHDMAGAVGAAAAGAELLEDGFDPETARLVAASAAGAAARLKFFRAALGPSGGEQPAPALRDLIAAYFDSVAASGGGALSLRWSCPRARLDGDMGRLVLNLALLAKDALPRGGSVTIEIQPESTPGRTGILVTFVGEGARLGDEVLRVAVSGEAPSGPREAQAWVARALAAKTGGGLVIEQLAGEGRIRA